MSPAQATLFLLRNNNISDGTTGWSGYYATTPEKGDQTVTLYDADPQYDGRGMRAPLTVFKHQKIQVGVRSRDYQIGWDYINSLVTFFASILNHSESSIGTGALFHMYGLRHGPIPAGREKNNLRYFFTADYITLIEGI